MAQKASRDYVYLAIAGFQLFAMLANDFVAFYPKSLYEAPGTPLHFLVWVRETYVALSGDPFFQPGYYSSWLHSFLFFELAVQFPLALYLIRHLPSKLPSSGPTELAGLVFGSTTAMGSLACAYELWEMGPDMLKAEFKTNLLLGTYLPFFVLPGIMAIDMYMRLLPRVTAEPGKTKKQ